MTKAEATQSPGMSIDEFDRGYRAGWHGANALAGHEFYRLKCLEIAAQSFHPDDSIPVEELMATADKLLRYVMEGYIPSGFDEPATPAQAADSNSNPGSVSADL